MLPDGGETQVASRIFRYNFAVAEKGLYFSTFDQKSLVIMFQDFATGKGYAGSQDVQVCGSWTGGFPRRPICSSHRLTMPAAISNWWKISVECG